MNLFIAFWAALSYLELLSDLSEPLVEIDLNELDLVVASKLSLRELKYYSSDDATLVKSRETCSSGLSQSVAKTMRRGFSTPPTLRA